MTKSKIKEILKVKDWEGDKGTVYYFTVKMENGDEYPIKKGKMKKDGYSVGQELNYLVEKDGEYDKIFIQEEMKPATNTSGGTTYKPQSNIASFSLSYSKDLAVAGKIELDAILPIADKFYEWLSSK